MAEGIGYYDCVTEEFLGEVADNVKPQVLTFFKDTLRHGDDCALIKVEVYDHRVCLEGYKRCRDMIVTITEEGI